jgi:hypothetical protein
MLWQVAALYEGLYQRVHSFDAENVPRLVRFADAVITRCCAWRPYQACMLLTTYALAVVTATVLAANFPFVNQNQVGGPVITPT